MIFTLIYTLRLHIAVGLLGTLALKSEDFVVFYAFFLMRPEDMMTGEDMMIVGIDDRQKTPVSWV